jgi:hypothetical protein
MEKGAIIVVIRQLAGRSSFRKEERTSFIEY